jgi:hypothetical protein
MKGPAPFMRTQARTKKEERLSYLKSRATEYGEVRSVVALKRGVGDHTSERFAEHEPRRNANNGGFFRFRASGAGLESG